MWHFHCQVGHSYSHKSRSLAVWCLVFFLCVCVFFWWPDATRTSEPHNLVRLFLAAVHSAKPQSHD